MVKNKEPVMLFGGDDWAKSSIGDYYRTVAKKVFSDGGEHRYTLVVKKADNGWYGYGQIVHFEKGNNVAVHVWDMPIEPITGDDLDLCRYQILRAFGELYFVNN